MSSTPTSTVVNGGGSLDWTSNFSEDEIDEDLASFQEDEMVQQALQRGVDLKKYGRELENDLRQVIFAVFWFNTNLIRKL